MEETELEKYSVKTPTDSEEHLPPFNELRNSITNAKKITKLVVTNLPKQPAENAEQNAVEEEEQEEEVEEDNDENNTVLDLSSGSAQENESKGM